MTTPLNNLLQHQTVSDRSAFTVLLGVIVLFMAVLIAGWSRLLVPLFPSNLFFAAWLIGIILAMIAVVAARSVAAEKVQLSSTKGTHKEEVGAWIASFVVLFLLSSLGTINTAFYFGEGRLVLTEAIDHAHETLDLLQATAPKALSNTQLDLLEAKINRLLAKLEMEITNSNGGKSCGVGDAARKIILELAAELPGYQELSGGTGVHACAGSEAKFRAVASSYRNTAYAFLRSNPTYIAAGGARSEAFLVAVRERVSQETKTLDAAKSGLSGGGESSGKSGSSYTVAQKALESAATTYQELRVELEKIADKQLPLPRSIVADQARQLGSLAQIIPSLLARMDRISTWVYLVLAVSLDVILIVCYMRVFRSAQRQEVARTDNSSTSKSAVSDLRFLWVNP